jgi:hypothetical protein
MRPTFDLRQLMQAPIGIGRSSLPVIMIAWSAIRTFRGRLRMSNWTRAGMQSGGLEGQRQRFGVAGGFAMS